MSNFKRLVQLDFEVEGFHNWGNAPIDVGYLRDRHRHIFKVRMWLWVKHSDRELEINKSQTFYSQYLKVKYGDEFGRCEFGGMSCEMIAEDILSTNENIQAVQVLEDGFGGAVVARE